MNGLNFGIDHIQKFNKNNYLPVLVFCSSDMILNKHIVPQTFNSMINN